jgi:hypothetical protein
MTRFIRKIQTVGLAVLAFSALPAFAEQSPGFYMGVGTGEADADLSAGDLDQLFRDAFRSQGGSYSPQASSIDNKDSSLYIFAGYRILPWLSAEGGYINLGEIDYTSRGPAFSPGTGTQQITTRMKVESQGLAVSALGNLPVGDYFEFHARVGFFGVNTDADVSGGSATRPINVSESGFSFSFQFGLGAAVNLGDHFSLSADWVHFFDVDNGDDEDEDFDYDGYDVDMLRLSAIVRF